MLIAVSHLDDVVRGWFLQFVFDLFNPGGRNTGHFLAGFFAGQTLFFSVLLINSFVFSGRLFPHGSVSSVNSPK